jgi:hypothetical protein
MFIDNHVDRLIGQKLIKENEEEKLKHISSGKLTASILGDPLQWQVLKVLGVETKGFDEYTLRKFKRGKDVEAWLAEYLNPIATQKEARYKNVVGYIDAVVDASEWDCKKGIIPIEIKSTSNAKFKRVVGNSRMAGGPDRGHIFQACLYALSEGSTHFGIAYVATDDLRVHTFILETKDYKDQVEAIIDRFDKQMKSGTVPEFVPEESWHENLKYCKYPAWMRLTPHEIEAKLLELNIEYGNTKTRIAGSDRSGLPVPGRG